MCDICGNELASKHNLRDHMAKIHADVTETINLVCETCGWSTSTKKTLRQHIRIKHAIDRHEKCPHCDYHTARLECMHVHIDSKHPDHDRKKFFCDHCSKSFIFEASLKKHLENLTTMARNRAKKLNQDLIERNRSKEYEEH